MDVRLRADSSRGSRLVLMLCALVLATTSVVAAPRGATAAKNCPRGVLFGDWTRLPIFEFETTAVSPSVNWAVHHAVDPDNPRLLYAASWHQILRSTNGGCTWTKAWEVPLAPTSEFPYSQAMSPRITSLVVADARRGPNPVHAALDILRGPEQVHLVRSDDGGATWASGDPQHERTLTVMILDLVGTAAALSLFAGIGPLPFADVLLSGSCISWPRMAHTTDLT